MRFNHFLTKSVFEDIKKQSIELNAKIKKYLELLDEKGHALQMPFVDKIESYKNLYELRPHHHNIEYRMIFFWRGNIAYFIHSFVEKGQKKKNQREYKIAEVRKKKLEKNIGKAGN
ncbi:MAG: type II toxin-antitoxin system RelE/ParE family toxin [Candidatus Goldbacteria bacterium]|nr:type II toxin-antitoxin system RelE/ParE family toxin [Candidatus Goldiibacteriota bacterium]